MNSKRKIQACYHSLKLISLEEATKDLPTKIVRSGFLGLTKTVVVEEPPVKVDEVELDVDVTLLKISSVPTYDEFVLSREPQLGEREKMFWKSISFTHLKFEVRRVEFGLCTTCIVYLRWMCNHTHESSSSSHHIPTPPLLVCDHSEHY
jgi:hypothetical protein